MKKMKTAMAVGAAVLVFSACGQTESQSPQETQTNAADDAAEISDGTSDPTESRDDVLGNLVGEYEYSLDDGTGRLTIKETSNGYDVSDYESESSYRFLADSSNIDSIEDNRIYIKYPEEVFSDGEAVFGYYILEYGADGIDVYYGKSAFEEAEFLYHAAKKTEASAQAVESADSETTVEELLDLFIAGSISAVDPTDSASEFYITDLNMDSEEWDSYSIGEKVDLDNDGENELILNGPYGGIYLDARDNKVYKFAAAEGTALILSYTYFNTATWIMYSNRSSAGFEFYHLEKYEGADNLAAEINFGEELVDFNNAEAGIKYTWNEAEISYDEYTALCSKIFAAEVSTN